MRDVPTILAVFANYPDLSPRHLRFLEKELDALKEMLERLDDDDKLKGRIKDIRDKEELLKFVKIHRTRVRLFHYGGHANTLSLDTVNTKLLIDNFVEYINLCTTLKLVVLNGCSTRGFVKRLFERTNVQAIIATNYEVGDMACQQFSAEFYDLLLRKEYTLETAFITAVSNFTKDQEFNREKNIYLLNREEGTITGIAGLAPRNPGQNPRARRSVSRENLFDSEEKPVPWGLYITDENVLDWKVYMDDTATEDRKDDLLKQKKGLEIQLLEKQNQIEKIEKNIRLFKDIGEKADELRTEAERELSMLQKDEAAIQKKKIELIEDVAKVSANLHEEIIVHKFSESFFELNYKDQIDIVYEVKHEQKFRGFILQGTPECAVNLLARRIIRILGIHETTVVHYDFESKFRRDGWEGLNIELGLNVKDHDPDGIVQEMVRHYRKNEAEESTQKGYLLLFRNSSKDDFSKKELREDIIRFWQDLVERFEVADGGRPFDHPIYLFLLDGHCDRKEEDNEYKSGRQKEYEEDAAGAGDTISVYPVVQPLNEETILEWQKKKEFSIPLIFSKKEIDELLNKSERFFLPAVQEMSGLKVKSPNLKQEAYRRFRELNVDNDFPKEI